jgi:putative endonuclease
MGRTYYVYMMTSNNRRALYIGVTNDLERRVWEHRQAQIKGFTSDYHCVHLVYYESCEDINSVIAREKQLKGWRREKKDRLVESINPHWKDLAADWF